MSSRYLIGLDAGGRSVRCLLVEINTGQITLSIRPWTFSSVPGVGWGYEIDVRRCWSLVADCIKESISKVKASPSEVLGIAITSMRHTTILLDRNGEVIFATPTIDARAAPESSAIGSQSGQELYKCTGRWPLPIFSAARLLWLSNLDPTLIQNASTVFSLNDWFAYKMCGEITSDATQAGETMLFDLEQRTWAWDWINTLGLPKHLFPEIKQSGTQLGELSVLAADHLGLPAGIPVATAGADTQCGLLGLGAIKSGDTAAIVGSTAPVQSILDTPMIDPEQRLWTGHYLHPGQWVLESNAGNMGETLAWFADFIFPDTPNPVARLFSEADLAHPGSGGLLSTFGAQLFDAHQMGAPVGNLTANSFVGGQGLERRQNLLRAVSEGLAYAIRTNLEQITRQSKPAKALKLGGGMSRSSFWCQVVSDVLGLPIYAPEQPDCSALGAAICAGVGSGVFKDLEEGAERLAKTGRLYEPNPEHVVIYNEIFSNWSRLKVAHGASDDLAADILLQDMIREKDVASNEGFDHFKPRILVTAEMDTTSLEILKSLGEVQYSSYREQSRLLTGESLVEALQGYHVFITEVDEVDQEVLHELPDLRLIVACRGNAMNVDISTCTALGIPVLNTPGRNAEAVAELALAFLLMLFRKIQQANAFLHQSGSEAGDMGRMGYAHEILQGIELSGKTIGLIGLGAVGRALAQCLAHSKVRLLIYDPFITKEEAHRANGELVTLDQLLQKSDIISLHAAVTEQTRGMIGVEQLKRIKPGAYLVNTARAALVDETALLESLQSGRLGGAALDVFSIEPPGSDNPLLALPNVIATPHIGGNTMDVASHQGQMAIDDLSRMLSGKVPNHVLNPETIQGFSWEGPRKGLEGVIIPGSDSLQQPEASDLIQEKLKIIERAMASPAQALPELVPPPSILPTGKFMDDRLSTQDSRSQMEKVLLGFIARAIIDPALIAFSAKKKIINHFTVNDLALEFYLSYQDGVVSGGVSAPPSPAEVRMKANAEIFDGIFTGRINGNKAAMSGKLSFSGDVRLAMGLQRVQKDLIRLYTASREAEGGLGDLSTIAKAATTLPIAESIKPNESIFDLRHELVRTIQELYQIQLITATGGNLSARIPDRDEVWISPSQLYKGDLKPEVMVRIDFEGNSLDSNAMAPSSERLVHTEIYKARPDVQAIIHAHAPYATILGLSGKPFLPVTTEAAFIKVLPLVPFVMPGTRELALSVVQAMGNNPAVLMQNHGIVVAASSLRQASNLLESIERNAQLILGCYAAGKKPPVLPKEVVKMLQEVGEMMA